MKKLAVLRYPSVHYFRNRSYSITKSSQTFWTVQVLSRWIMHTDTSRAGSLFSKATRQSGRVGLCHHWFSLPLPQTHPCLIHPHTIIRVSPSLCHTAVKPTQPDRLCSEPRSSKTSEVGANSESRLTLFIHQLFFFSPPKSWGRGVNYCLLQTFVKEQSLSQPSVPDAFSPVLPTATIRELIPANIPKGGQPAWTDETFSMLSICTVPQWLHNLQLLFLHWLHVHVVFDVCIYLFFFFLKKMTTSVYCWCLCRVQLVGFGLSTNTFKTGSLLVLLLVKATHWKHCLLVSRDTTRL